MNIAIGNSALENIVDGELLSEESSTTEIFPEENFIEEKSEEETIIDGIKYIIQDRLGFPKKDLSKLKAWSFDTSEGLSQRLTEDEEIACAERLVKFQHYMNDTFEEKRKNPQEDIISDLVNFRFEDGSQLITEELL